MGTEPKRPRLKPIDRQQMVLRAVDVERLVPEDHPVRAIWEFVGRLDLSGFYAGIAAVEGRAGQSALDPRLLLSLWVYAYSEGISSAREVSRLCDYDPAFQWLTGLEGINHHTLSDFRVQHGEALDELFRQVLGRLSAEGLITLKRVMQDGTKVLACAGRDTFQREEKVRAHLELAEEQIRQMGDPREEGLSQRVAKARERALREHQAKLESALEELEKVRAAKSTASEKERSRVSETDPEARIMKLSDGGFAPAYNVQLSADAAEGMIVAAEVTQAGGDYAELSPAVERIEANLGNKPQQMVADGGFTSRENILALDQQGVDFIGSLGDEEGHSQSQLQRRGAKREFGPADFLYEEEHNRYRCPEGKILSYEGQKKRPGCEQISYRAPAADCRNCVQRERCCPENAVYGRMVVRIVEHPVVAKFRQKMETQEARQIYRQRSQVAEFPFAWIKEKMGLRRFRLRGRYKARVEILWASLAFNLKQWIRLRWRLQWAQ